MRTTMILTTLLMLCIGIPAQAEEAEAAYCPYGEGQILKPLIAREVFDNVDPDALKKDEFETTREFEQRKEKSRRMSRMPFPILAQNMGLWRDANIKYDADRQVFLIPVDDILRRNGYFDEAMKKKWRDGKAPRNYHALQIDFSSRYRPNTYEVNNAGDKIEVIRGKTQYWSIYIREKERHYDKLFIGERREKITTFEENVVVIPVPRHQARHVKKTLRFAPIIQPRKPYRTWLEYHKEADINKTGGHNTVVEVNAEFPVLIADVPCMAILNEDNKVLKIVKAYRPSVQHQATVLANELKAK